MGRVSCVAPAHDFWCEGITVADTSIKALPGKRRKLELGQVQPAALERGLGQFNCLREIAGLLRGQRLVERAGGGRMQVILDQPHPSALPITCFQQRVHERRIINGRAAHADLGKTPTAQGFEGTQYTTGALAHIFVILTCGPARFHGHWR